MGREIELNLIALDVGKNLVFSVQEQTTLEQISQHLVQLYKDSQKDSFAYRKTDDQKELALPNTNTIGDLINMGDSELVLYVTCRSKKGDTCCLIY